jgi:acyl carrier protein
MDRNEIEKKVLEHIIEIYGVQEVQLDEKFLNLGDTLDVVELMMELEMEFGNKVSDEEVDEVILGDVNALVDLFDRKLEGNK